MMKMGAVMSNVRVISKMGLQKKLNGFNNELPHIHHDSPPHCL